MKYRCCFPQLEGDGGAPRQASTPGLCLVFTSSDVGYRVPMMGN